MEKYYLIEQYRSMISNVESNYSDKEIEDLIEKVKGDSNLKVNDEEVIYNYVYLREFFRRKLAENWSEKKAQIEEAKNKIATPNTEVPKTESSRPTGDFHFRVNAAADPLKFM